MAQQIKALTAKLLALWVVGTFDRLLAHLFLNLNPCPTKRKGPHLVCILLAENGARKPDLLLLWFSTRKQTDPRPDAQVTSQFGDLMSS